MSHAGRIYAYTTPAYRDTPWRGRRRGRGLVKVGFTTRDPHVRIREQIGASSPERDPYRLLLTAPARDKRGREISDKDLHRALRAAGVAHVRGEWFECGTGDIRRALASLDVRARSARRRSPPRHRRRRRRRSRGMPAEALLAGAVLLAMLFFPETSAAVVEWGMKIVFDPD